MALKNITTEYGIESHKDGSWTVYHGPSGRDQRGSYATEDEATTAAHKAQAYSDKRGAEIAANQAAKIAAATAPTARLADHATPRQVDYILSLIARGAHEEGGYYDGPTTRTGIQQMTKASASAYIDSLTSRY